MVIGINDSQASTLKNVQRKNNYFQRAKFNIRHIIKHTGKREA